MTQSAEPLPPSRPTRVAPDIASPGRWVAQYYDAQKRLWFDIGDPRDTEDEARAHLAAEESRR
jgi:hypothetical protein